MRNKESLASKTIGGSFWNFSASVTQRIGGLVFAIIIARFLLSDGFGLFNLVMSIILIFLVFSQEGFDRSVMRYISEASKNKKKQRGTFRYLVKLKLIFLTSLSLILITISFPLAIYVFDKPAMLLPLLFGAAFMFISSMEGLLISFFYAINRVRLVAVREIIFQVLRGGLVLILLFSSYSGNRIIVIFSVLIVSSFLTLLFAIYKIYRVAPHVFSSNGKISKGDKKRIFSFSGYTIFASMSSMFLVNIDIIMLGLLVPQVAYVGFYKVAFMLSSSVAGLLTFSRIFLPAFVNVKKRNMESIFNRVYRYALILIIPAAFGLASLGRGIIKLIFGAEYLEAVYPLYVLAIVMIVIIQVDLFISLFLAKEKPREYIHILILVVLLNIVLNYLIIKILAQSSPVLAMVGAALATLISWTAYLVGLNILSRRNLKIKAKHSLMIKPFIAATAMSLVILFFQSKIEVGLIAIALLIIIGALVYIAVLIAIKGIGKEDYFVMEIVMKKLKPFFKANNRRPRT